MKKFLVLIAVTVLALPLSAQNLFGVKAGMLFQADRISSMPELDIDHAGFTGGLYWRSELKGLPFYIQPELIYNVFDYRVADLSNWLPASEKSAKPTSGRLTNSSLHLPLLAGIKLAFLRLNAGPDFKLCTFNRDSNYALKTSKLGFIVGGGITCGVLDIDVRYRANLDKSKLHYTDIKDALFRQGGYTSVTVGLHF